MHLKNNAQSVFSICLALFLSACDNTSALINFYDKSLRNKKLKCLSYIPASNKNLDLELLKLYKFSKNCPYTLELFYKNNIVCNSPYNVPLKVNSNFPSAYIKLEVRKGFKLEYSYYKDLTHKANLSDLKDAFNRLKDDIL